MVTGNRSKRLAHLAPSVRICWGLRATIARQALPNPGKSQESQEAQGVNFRSVPQVSESRRSRKSRRERRNVIHAWSAARSARVVAMLTAPDRLGWSLFGAGYL